MKERRRLIGPDGLAMYFFFRVFTALGVTRRDAVTRVMWQRANFYHLSPNFNHALAFDQSLDLAIIPAGILRELYNFAVDDSG